MSRGFAAGRGRICPTRKSTSIIDLLRIKRHELKEARAKRNWEQVTALEGIISHYEKQLRERTSLPETCDYLGQNLKLIKIYDERKNPDWDRKAQEHIDAHKGKACCLHKGHYHGLYGLLPFSTLRKRTYAGMEIEDEWEVKDTSDSEEEVKHKWGYHMKANPYAYGPTSPLTLEELKDYLVREWGVKDTSADSEEVDYWVAR